MWVKSEKCGGLQRTFNGLSFWLVLTIALCHEVILSSALFEGCDHNIFLNAGGSFYLASPNYPSNYPPNTSCRYAFIAPIDFGINIKCTLRMPKSPTGCSTERLYFSSEGDLNIVGAEEFCGFGTFERDSLFRSATLAYVSYGFSGNFNCVVSAQRRPCDCGWSLSTRIRNGQDALPNEFPSAVALKDRTSLLESFCGGTIISHYYILTAAHCIRRYHNVRFIVALVGAVNLSNQTESPYAAQYDIAEKFEHPGYSGINDTNDIAILKTTQAIEWSKGVGPICLPPISEVNNNFDYQSVKVIGWGLQSSASTKSHILQKAQLLITDNLTCGRDYANISRIVDSHLCAYDSLGEGRNTCGFDSGGPIILNKKRQFQVGVTISGTDCGEGNYTIGVNTRVTSYLQWIEYITQYSSCHVRFN